MDLLDRARAIAACPLFAELAPAVVIRLAERARPTPLAAGERCTTDDDVWVVADGVLAVTARAEGGARAALAGHALGLIRVIAAQTPVVEAIAEMPSLLLGLALDDLRDVLEEDPAALAAIAAALARALLAEEAPAP